MILLGQQDVFFVIRLHHLFNNFMNCFVKSSWIPPNFPLWIECPLTAIKHELCSLIHCHKNSSNLSRSEYYSLSNLRSLHNV